MGDWYISENNNLSGPASDDEVRRAIAGRRINENTLISPDGKDNWQRCGETDLFKNCFPVKSSIKLKLIPKINPAAGVEGALTGGEDKAVRKISLKTDFKGAAPIPKVEPKIFAVKDVEEQTSEVTDPAPEVLPLSSFDNALGELSPSASSDSNSVAATLSVSAAVDYDVTGEKRIVCPHCWHEFYAGNMLYISQHPELTGDPVVPEGQLRFIPKHFTKNGLALDAKGMECPDMACPRCHLRIPQIVADLNTLFFSVVGAPASGKSYFITTMINSLRHHLPERFGISFVDADPINNVEINNYENRLFLSDTPDELVALEKTQMTGGMYDNIIWENREVNLPKPFIYQLRKFDYQENRQKNFGVVFYDNAGEHFQPGNEDFNNPGTQHLALSDGIVFLFDPTLDPRFRKYIVSETNSADERIKMQNQNILLSEMLSRLRRRRAIGFSDKYTRPLLIVISKYDQWRHLLPLDVAGMEAVSRGMRHQDCAVDGYILDNVAYYTRKLLMNLVPEFVSEVEMACSNVIFLPNSSLGASPEYSESRHFWGVRPSRIKPIWSDVPFLWMLAQKHLINIQMREADDVTFIPAEYWLEDYLICFKKRDGAVVRLPANYGGKIIKDIEAGGRFLVPSAGKSSSVDDGEKGDFWENL